MSLPRLRRSATFVAALAAGLGVLAALYAWTECRSSAPIQATFRQRAAQAPHSGRGG